MRFASRAAAVIAALGLVMTIGVGGASAQTWPITGSSAYRAATVSFNGDTYTAFQYVSDKVPITREIMITGTNYVYNWPTPWAVTTGGMYGPSMAVLGGTLYLVYVGTDNLLYMVSTVNAGPGASWTPPVRIVTDGAASSSPSLVQIGNRLQMVWKGLGNDTHMYTSWSTNGINWAPQSLAAPDGGTSTDPAMAVGGPGLLLAWRGIGNDDHLYYSSSSDGLHWIPQELAAPDGGSSAGPAIYATGLDPFFALAWKGVGNDTAVYYSYGRLDSTGGVTSWTAQRRGEASAVTITTPDLYSVNGTGTYILNKPFSYFLYQDAFSM